MHLSVYIPRYFPILKRRPLKTKVHLVDTTTFSETCATIITLCRLLYYPRQQLLHSPLFPVSKRFSMWCRWRNNTELNHTTYLLLRYWWYASFNSFYVVICLESWNKKEKCQSTYVVLLTIMKPYYWSVIFFCLKFKKFREIANYFKFDTILCGLCGMVIVPAHYTSCSVRGMSCA